MAAIGGDRVLAELRALAEEAVPPVAEGPPEPPGLAAVVARILEEGGVVMEFDPNGLLVPVAPAAPDIVPMDQD